LGSISPALRAQTLPNGWVPMTTAGRVCARKAGLIEPKPRRRASDAERDTFTRDLFEGVTT
jgi:hypothetical protein